MQEHKLEPISAYNICDKCGTQCRLVKENGVWKFKCPYCEKNEKI